MAIKIYLLVILLVSIISFCLYGCDKKKSQKHQWRIPEKTLLGSGLLGGSIGSLLGMYFFRHKTNHWYFKAFNVIFLIIQIALGIVIYMYI